MRGLQILSLALVAFCGKSFAVPLSGPDLGKPEISIARREDSDRFGEKLVRDEDEPGSKWKRDEEPGSPWRRDEEEPGSPWKRFASRV